MRKIITTSLVITAFAAPGIALAQPKPSRSVDDYVCTFAGTCDQQPAAEPAEQGTAGQPARKGRTSSTRGFSLARPAATGNSSTTASPSKSSPRKVAPMKSASVTRPKAPVKPVAAQGQRADLRLSFELGSATLTPVAMAEAKVFAESLMRPELANMKFAIEGHTDAQGGREYNLDLSRRRAQAVADYLVSLGVSPDRLEVHGFGYDKPLPGRSASAQENRRVEALRTS